MAKKDIKVTPAAPVKPLQPVFNFPLKVKYIILAAIGLIFYGNTLRNSYALDDNGVILGNAYVQEGVTGIYKIMTTDAYSSYLAQLGASQNFVGGRYRPLSIVAFAIEHTIFGESKDNNIAWLRHLINILFYIATICAIYFFLANFLLKKVYRGEDCSFLAAVLFAIHPLHTEVAANIKSFDEILSLFFILLTFIFALKGFEKNNLKYMFCGLISFFLAMLSKEYAIILLLFPLPLLFYLNPLSKKINWIIASAPYYAVAFLYLLLRFYSVGVPHSDPNVRFINNQLRTDPYYLATHVQKIATEWYALGKYIFMLFVPYPLACDYSYNQIPYHNFADITVWLSILAYIGIAYWGFKLLMKKNVIAFPIFFFLFTLIPISNFIINVGAVYAERFDYHASLGFVVVISFLVFNFTKKIAFSMRKTIITGTLGLLVLVCAVETIARNMDWENDYTLFMHDVKVVPNSEFADCDASVGYINLGLQKGNESRKIHMLDTAVMLCRRAIILDKTFPDPFINAGLAYYYLSNLDSAKYFWDIVQNGLYPNHPKVKMFMPLLAKSYLNEARAIGRDKPMISIREIKKGISEDSSNADLWYNLGGLYFMVARYDSARMAWNRSLALKPDSNDSRHGLDALNSMRSAGNKK